MRGFLMIGVVSLVMGAGCEESSAEGCDGYAAWFPLADDSTISVDGTDVNPFDSAGCTAACAALSGAPDSVESCDAVDAAAGVVLVSCHAACE